MNQHSVMILVVEDEPAVRTLLASGLHAAGYNVLSAPGSIEAYDVFEQNLDRISVLITDLSLPHLNGVELAASFKLRSPHLKVIAISGQLTQTDETPPGADLLLMKPFTIPQLHEAIHTVLSETCNGSPGTSPRR